MKDKTTHLYVDSHERTLILHSLVELKNALITKLIPKTVPKGQETDFVVKALEFYNRHLQRNKSHER